ncbi:MAG: hypothetical protein ABS82_16655 [Rhodanobacter sp. SCN 67-45]|nr:MAG: hypothetical protein ABS82_16655 [Rhodanobacter sp. SCN 67-45]
MRAIVRDIAGTAKACGKSAIGLAREVRTRPGFIQAFERRAAVWLALHRDRRGDPWRRVAAGNHAIRRLIGVTLGGIIMRSDHQACQGLSH